MTNWTPTIVIDDRLEVARTMSGIDMSAEDITISENGHNQSVNGYVLDLDQYNGCYWRINPTGNSLGAPCVEILEMGKLGFQAFVHGGKSGVISIKLFVPVAYLDGCKSLVKINLINNTIEQTEIVITSGVWDTIDFVVAPVVDTIYKIEVIVNCFVKNTYIPIESVLVVET